MKKLTLNKQTIARLDNPDKIYGGTEDVGTKFCKTCEVHLPNTELVWCFCEVCNTVKCADPNDRIEQ